MQMTTIALPVFRSRIAPVFDSCLRVLVLRVQRDGRTKRSELNFNGLSALQRVSTLQRAGVTALICGGISTDLQTIFEGSQIRVVTGIAGPVEEVFAAFMSDRLDDPAFYMPGRKGRNSTPGTTGTHHEEMQRLGTRKGVMHGRR